MDAIDITISTVMPILEHVNSTWLCFVWSHGQTMVFHWLDEMPRILIIIERVITDTLKTYFTRAIILVRRSDSIFPDEKI